jgi:hypothetical protein
MKTMFNWIRNHNPGWRVGRWYRRHYLRRRYVAMVALPMVLDWFVR